MDDKNEVVFVDRGKLQGVKKWCAVMHNNFVNKTLNHSLEKKNFPFLYNMIKLRQKLKAPCRIILILWIRWKLVI